jgi:imidazolonepropionase
LLTLRGNEGPRRGSELKDLQIISDGSLLIEGNILKEVGPTRRIENLAAARGAIEISAVGKVVMPGFVDSHTHLAFPPPGTEGDHERALRLIRGVTGKRLRSQYRVSLAAMARHGTTTVEVKTGCGEDAAEIKLLRVLGSLDGDPLDVLPTYLFRPPLQDRTTAVDRTAGNLLPTIRRRRLARFADLLWEEERPDPELYDRYLGAVRELGFVPKVHTAADCCSEAIRMAVRHNAMSVGSLDQATEADAQLLARSRTMATLTPGGAPEGSGSRTARLMADSGAAMALATDFNPNRTGTLSMQTVVALAHMRLGLSVDEAIAAATINGAHALGCADRTGSLEPGKFADLLMLDAPDYHELGRHLGANMVHLVMKRGRLIYKEAEVARPLPFRGSRVRL